MKKVFAKIIPALLILIVVGMVFVPQQVHANIFDGAVDVVVNTIIGNIATFFIKLTSVIVEVSGIFLSISINLTIHIGDFFNSIPALKDVWVVVRNISSIFIIFMLLYSSITTIIGVGSSNVKSLVGKIIMAGLLINFSLFFVKVAVDASNLVSLQFYRAIAPGTAENLDVGKVFTDGGLSDVFMSSLKIPQVYANKGALDSIASISVATIGGIIMMLTASVSFFAAAIMFTFRTGILMFIMALSPLFFAGMIFPQIKSGISEKLLKQLKEQLIFMPAYLFLMYIALKLISSDGFHAIFNQSANGVPKAGEGAFGPTFIGVIIQYVIALFFINAPLVFAIQAGGVGGKWAPDMFGVSKWFGKSVGGGAWRNTGGRIASRVAQDERVQRFAGKYFVGEQLRKGVAGVAKGYDEKLAKRLSSREAVYDSLSDKKAKTEYSGRLNNSLIGKTGKYSMATTGRADRVGAAKILTKRKTELTADLSKLTSELNQINTAASRAGGLTNLPLYQQQRVDQLTGTNVAGGNPGLSNEITDAQSDLNVILAQIEQFQLNTGGTRTATGAITGGATPRQVSKRNF